MDSNMVSVAGNGTGTELVYHIITLSDPDVLDCPICFDPLTVPVFQCENGHITCSDCTTNVRNKCPSCQKPINVANRCRAIEKVIESVIISCPNSKYGCSEKIRYCNKKEHVSVCAHLPCSCPHLNCTFMSSPKKLSAHFTRAHPNVAKPFQLGFEFQITLEPNQKKVILQEKDGLLFILNNPEFRSLGSAITISCIQPSTIEEEFHYHVSVVRGGCVLQMYNFAKNVTKMDENPNHKKFLMVPRNCVDSSGRLTVGVLVFPNSTLNVEPVVVRNSIR